MDPHFRRTVIYLVAHDPEEGSYGLVLNRRADKTAGELTDAIELGPLAQVPVFFGGPVGQDRLTFAAMRWRKENDSIECLANLAVEDAVRLALEPDVVVRGFAGYAGWSGGQLEAELEQKAWVVQKPDSDILDATLCEGMWISIVQNFGPWFRLLAAAPDDPSLN